MKVLVFGRTIPDKAAGSKGLFEFNQAKSLKKQNIDVVYFFIDNRSILELKKVENYQSELDGISVYGVFNPIRGLPYTIYDRIKFKYFKDIFETILSKHGQFDILHIHFPLYTLNKHIINYLTDLDIKIVVTEHWSKVQSMKLSKREEKNLNDLFYLSDVFITVSSKLKNSVLEYKKQLNNKTNLEIKVVPNIIESNCTYVERIENHNYYTFTSIGRLTKAKKNNIIIKAFNEISKECSNVRLIIIGDGPRLSILKNLVIKYDLEEKVRLTGFLEYGEIMQQFIETDAYITASEIETFGVPVVESWIMGRPVIIGDNHPLDYLITDDNGVVYQYSKNVDQRVNNIVNAMKESIHRNFNGKKISSETYNKFSEEKIVSKLINIYKRDLNITL